MRTALVTVAIAMVGAAFVARSASAQATPRQTGSIFFLPRIVADGSRDTSIQVANTSNGLARLRCFYLNGALANPDLPPGPLNEPLCTALEFQIAATRQQPLFWVASEGLEANPIEDQLPLGSVPPVPERFTGALICIEVDFSGVFLSGNHFFASAIVTDRASGDVASYEAPTLRGTDEFDFDNTAMLGTGEYEGCPSEWFLEHSADGAGSALAGADTDVEPRLTVLPCTHDLDTLDYSPLSLQFAVFDELEVSYQASSSFGCWGDVALDSISNVFGTSVLTTGHALTRVQNAGGKGFILLSTELWQPLEGGGGSASDVARAGSEIGADILRFPGE